MVYGHRLDTQQFVHPSRECLTPLFAGTVDAHFLDTRDGTTVFGLQDSLGSGAEESHHFGVVPGQAAGDDGAGGGHADRVHEEILQHCEQLVAARVEQQDQSRESTGKTEPCIAAPPRHADGGGIDPQSHRMNAGHHSRHLVEPIVVIRYFFARVIDAPPRQFLGLSPTEFQVGLLYGVDTFVGGEQTRHILIADQEGFVRHGLLLCSNCC